MTVSDMYDTHGCPVIDNTYHIEIIMMGPIETQESVSISTLNGKLESLKSLSRFGLAKQKAKN